jgi:hypothetical protein
MLVEVNGRFICNITHARLARVMTMNALLQDPFARDFAVVCAKLG